ncbi:MAG: hypothetical protein EA397_03525 [Deltaproteobacteria bacterium]|nr:MAG: hypothetical protein EA397_03525 [Deltaproteobacteria bacterium]
MLLLICGATARAEDPLSGPASPPVWQAYSAERAVDPLQWKPLPPALVGDRPATLELHMAVPEGFHLYKDKIWVEVLDAGSLAVGAVELPPGRRVETSDPERPHREVFDEDVVLRLPIQASPATPLGLATMVLSVHHQGCYDGTCLPPQRRHLRVLIPVRPNELANELAIEPANVVDDESVYQEHPPTDR